MKETILEKILAAKRTRLAKAKSEIDIAVLAERAREFRSHSQTHRLHGALSAASQINIIAEFKRASPSKGLINDAADPTDIARAYEAGGAAAISVLTEEGFFVGTLGDLKKVRAATSLPVLRKDFIIDEFQIYESAAAGADSILLIVAALTDAELKKFHQLAHDELGLDVVVEVHTPGEFERAVAMDAAVIGVNNRDLRSFEVSLDVSRELVRSKPSGSLMISESGLRSAAELSELHELGYDAFLIGETLMRSKHPELELRTWLTKPEKQALNY
jgi:indole-3-glycerol phosphate synthase